MLELHVGLLWRLQCGQLVQRGGCGKGRGGQLQLEARQVGSSGGRWVRLCTAVVETAVGAAVGRQLDGGRCHCSRSLQMAV